jgi:hypothetical protein
VYFAKPGVLKQYPLNATDGEVQYDYHVNVLGKTPEEYYSTIEPVTQIGKMFKAVQPYFQYGQQAMKLLAVRPDIALGIKSFDADNPTDVQQFAQTHKAWGDIWVERFAENEKEATAAHAGRDKAMLKAHSAPQLLKWTHFVPWFLTEALPGEMFDVGTRPSSWIAAGAAERAIGAVAKYGPQFIHSVLEKAPKSAREFFYQELWKSESNLAPAFEKLGLQPNAPTSQVRQAWKAKAAALHPDKAGVENDVAFKELNAAYSNIMETRKASLNAFMDKFRQPISEVRQAKARPNLSLASESGSADLIPSEGDVVKVGKNIGKLLQKGTEMSTVNIAGKTQQVPTSQLAFAEEPKQNKGGLQKTLGEDYAVTQKINDYGTPTVRVEHKTGAYAELFETPEQAPNSAIVDMIANPRQKGSKPGEGRALMQQLQKHYDTLYLAAASKKGAKLAEDTGFTLMSPAIKGQKMAGYEWNKPKTVQSTNPNAALREGAVKKLPQDFATAEEYVASKMSKSRGMDVKISAKKLMELNPSIKSLEDAETLLNSIKTTPHQSIEDVILENKLTAEWEKAKAKKGRFDERGEADLVPNVNPEDELKAAASIEGASAVSLNPEKLPESAINTERMAITEEAKKKLAEATKSLGKEIENQTGKPMSHDEVLERAKEASILTKGVSREATLNFAAALLKTRQHVGALAEQKELTPEFLDSLRVLANTGTDLGRLVESFKISAMPEYATVKIKIIKELQKLGVDAEKILEAAKGVDFKDQNQVADFYHKFVKPQFIDELNEFAYINILSSPRTHIVNLSSNVMQLAGLNPLTRLASGAVDMVGSTLTGAERQRYISEIPEFYKGAINAMPEAMQAAQDALAGKAFVERPDIKHLPTKAKWIDYATLGLGKYVTRALEAEDVFVRTLIEQGEEAALFERYSHGQELTDKLLRDIQQEARQRAEYYVFRAPVDVEGKLGQGEVLKGIDKMTSAVYRFRDVPGARWFIRFVRTPMNILKQGIEYSPAGFSTLKGAKDPQEQAGKAIIGSIVFAGAYYNAMAGNSTWAVPTNKAEKELFYQSGRIPYSVKIGNNWVSYSKLGPTAYPLAMAAALHYYEKEAPTALSDTQLERAGKALQGIMQFFSDQSYVQSLGDVLKTLRGDAGSVTRLVTGVPSQLIPLSSLQRWVNNIIDPFYRKSETGLSVESITQNLEKSIVGLSQTIPAAKDVFQQPAKKQMPIVNAVSPLAVSPENKSGEAMLKMTQQAGQAKKKSQKQIEQIKKGLMK